ncbi:hypothetical protein MMMDOFMJ_3101 [Methylobacterium gnaphalii]|nr:hypothetical protein MMMDOFMJ_3101 [Methylobacterium gnaphalii]
MNERASQPYVHPQSRYSGSSDRKTKSLRALAVPSVVNRAASPIAARAKAIAKMTARRARVLVMR